MQVQAIDKLNPKVLDILYKYPICKDDEGNVYYLLCHSPFLQEAMGVLLSILEKDLVKAEWC